MMYLDVTDYCMDVCCISLLDHGGRFLTRLLTEPDNHVGNLCGDDKNNIYVAFEDKIKVFR